MDIYYRVVGAVDDRKLPAETSIPAGFLYTASRFACGQRPGRQRFESPLDPRAAHDTAVAICPARRKGQFA